MPNFEFLASTVPEIWRGPKIPKLGYVAPLQSLNRGSPVTPYLDSLTLICLFTIQLSLGQDDD